MKSRSAEAQLQDLEPSLENNGYTCGNKIKVGGGKFYAKQAIHCGDPIEAYYYNPLRGTRGSCMTLEGHRRIRSMRNNRKRSIRGEI
eukprot:14134149-Ditylum_brightwellii.AAC.1